MAASAGPDDCPPDDEASGREAPEEEAPEDDAPDDEGAPDEDPPPDAPPLDAVASLPVPPSATAVAPDDPQAEAASNAASEVHEHGRSQDKGMPGSCSCITSLSRTVGSRSVRRAVPVQIAPFVRVAVSRECQVNIRILAVVLVVSRAHDEEHRVRR